jgi:hypothetical protein
MEFPSMIVFLSYVDVEASDGWLELKDVLNRRKRVPYADVLEIGRSWLTVAVGPFAILPGSPPKGIWPAVVLRLDGPICCRRRIRFYAALQKEGWPDGMPPLDFLRQRIMAARLPG